jgi:chromosome segregation ATPase
MWKTKVFCIMVFALLSLFLSWPSVGICSESRTYTISETELTQLQNHLDALANNNAMLQNILSESGEELTKALDALMMSQKELEKLRAELLTCKTEAESARQSLAIANSELAKASESFKASERERDKIEGRLRTQRNIWEVLCAIAAGIAIAK